MREIALPVMRRMRDDVDETIILSVARRRRRINVEFMESTQNTRRVRQMGPEIPLYVGAAGRALLSGFSEENLRAYLASAAAADGVVISGLDAEAFAREVATVRDSGVSVVEHEFSADLCAVSTPIRDHAGRVAAALTISVPADRFTPEFRRIAERVARRGARDISQLIGYTGDIEAQGGGRDE
jgi:DNA-binding IclR family transcriptional regulator